MPSDAPRPATSDAFGRPLRKLRISVTDRCNLRCSYCMPRERYSWLPRESLLDFEEIARLARAMAGLGVDRIRLTGGEPLLRSNVCALVGALASTPGVRSVALTTNGLLLAREAVALRAAGLQGVTVSLDTLRRERFEQVTRRDALHEVLQGIDAALAAGFSRMKTNTVVMRGVNDDELIELVELARGRKLQPRFIEYMDVGGAMNWRPELVVSRAELLQRLGAHYGPLHQLRNRDGAPADRYALPDGFVVGVISSTTQPFCSSCDRSRMTADGTLLTCLYASDGLDLRTLLRRGASDDELREVLARRWRARSDRGAEARLRTAERGPLVSVETLLGNPRLEMHKRGG